MRGRSSHPPKAAAGISLRPSHARLPLRGISQALREKIGDLAFFELLRDWATQNRYGTVTTQFFKVWIYQAEKPAPGSW